MTKVLVNFSVVHEYTVEIDVNSDFGQVGWDRAVSDAADQLPANAKDGEILRSVVTTKGGDLIVVNSEGLYGY